MSNLIDPQTGEWVGGDKNAEVMLRSRLNDLIVEKVKLDIAIGKNPEDYESRLRRTEVNSDIASIKGALSL